MLSKFKKRMLKSFVLQKRITIKKYFKKLANLGVLNLLVEGGAKVFNSFFKENLFDNIYIFRSSFFSGIKENKFLEGKINMCKSKTFKMFVKKFGDDSLEIYKNNYV